MQNFKEDLHLAIRKNVPSFSLCMICYKMKRLSLINQQINGDKRVFTVTSCNRMIGYPIPQAGHDKIFKNRP